MNGLEPLREAVVGGDVAAAVATKGHLLDGQASAPQRSDHSARLRIPRRGPRCRRPASALLRDRTTVLLGGAPLTANHAHELGADGYALGAAAGTRLARKLMLERTSIAS